MIDHTFAVKKLKSLENLIVIFSQTTRMPFVECDAETYDDQVHIFANETGVEEFAKEYAEKKFRLMAMKVSQKQTQGVFNSFYSIGANVIVFHENGNVHRLQLEDVAKKPDMERLMKEKLPILNPTLQLSALYFLQEIQRPVEHDMKYARELEEEMLINLMRSKYILPLESADPNVPLDPKVPNQKKRIPYVKDKDGKMFLAAITDVAEFQKFYKDKARTIGMVVQQFEDLSKHVVNPANGMILNPGGFHLHVTKEQLDKLTEAKNAQKAPKEEN